MEITSRENPHTKNGGNTNTNTSTHLPITRSDPNSPYPTTFVTADSSSFKQVVQMLTGSPSSPSNNNNNNNLPPFPSSSRSFVIPPVKTGPNKKHHLYERRMKNNLLMINPLAAAAGRNHPPEILSPSVLDFPSLTLSPVTPLTSSAAGDEDSSEEERGIAERGFYLHRSPISTPRDAQPQLLPLFPVTSPRVSDNSSSTS